MANILPQAVLDDLMQDVERFRKEFPEAQVAFKRDSEGQPYLAFGSFGDMWDCAGELLGYYVWERHGIGLVADGWDLFFEYRPPADPNEGQSPLMRLVRFYWAEEAKGGPRVLGHIEAFSEIGFATPEEAQAAAELVSGRFGVVNMTVIGQGVKFSFEEE